MLTALVFMLTVTAPPAPAALPGPAVVPGLPELGCIVRNTADGKGDLAWTVSTGGADCRISKKATKWGKRVAIEVGKKTKPGAGTCELRVVVQ